MKQSLNGQVIRGWGRAWTLVQASTLLAPYLPNRRRQWLCCALCALLWLGLIAQPAQAQAQNNDAELVYLDAQGYIRALDLTHPNRPAVEWVSPVGGWVDFALGDFNGDGDSEIVAVKGAAGSGWLTVYDPVVTGGPIDTDKIINSIPWRILYETPIVGSPFGVATGNLDPAVAGDEIIYGARLNMEDDDPTNDRRTLVILHTTDPTGSGWAPFAERTTSTSQWSEITVGDLDGVAPAEVIIVSREGTLEVYQLNGQSFTRILDYESQSRPWRAATVARFFSTGLPGLAASRSSSPGAHSFWVFVYEPNNEGPFRDAHSEYFLPAPERLFAGDINGNGDEEIFFLRSVPANVTNLPRLVMRNRGGDILPAFEQPLDTDNGFQGGVAADVDGDGRAEVIIMRDNQLRVYTQPEVNATATDYPTSVATNGRTLHAGNLDRNGYLRTPTFSVTPARLEGDLAAGEESALGSFSLSNIGVGDGIPFTIHSLGNPTWLRLTGATGQTPATFTAAFDARLLMAGVYTTTILIESSNDQVSNAPFPIDVKLTVRPGLVPRSLGIVANAPSCAADVADLVVSLEIDGPTGMTFVAEILSATLERSADTGIEWPSAVPWVAVQSPNSAPTTMQLIFRPRQLTAGLASATLQLTAADAEGEQIRRVPLILICAQTQLYLPLITR